MKRREFITFFGAAAAWPLAARAQQPTKLPTIGFLGTTTLSAMSGWVAAFVQRLRELGWIEGRTVAIVLAWLRMILRLLLLLALQMFAIQPAFKPAS